MNTVDGVIIKGIGGFYYVDIGDCIIECRARGIFRKKGFIPLVGDKAEIEVNQDGKTGVVSHIHERQSVLIRPAVANVTQMVAVVAQSSPKPNTYVLDKLIASAEFAGLKVAVCFNKSDLGGDEDVVDAYVKAGFETIITSAVEKTGVEDLRSFLKDEITVFAGNSGVGKSSLLNELVNSEKFETGMVSEKLERGRHTTRHSELAELPFGGYIIDTPGFSSFDVNTIPLTELAGMFREFDDYTGCCRFPDCSHTAEPDCGVIGAVRSGEIAASRHESYLQLYREIKNLKQR